MWCAGRLSQWLMLSVALVGCARVSSENATAQSHVGAAGDEAVLTDGGTSGSSAHAGGASDGGAGDGGASDGGASDGGASDGDSERGGSSGESGVDAGTAGHSGAPGGGFGGASSATCAGPLTFEDPDVDLTVRNILGKPNGPIFAEDAAEVTDLSALLFANVSPLPCLDSSCSIVGPPKLDGWVTSVRGLECLTALETLSFDAFLVADFAPLAPLKQLKALNLGRSASLLKLPRMPQLLDLRAFSPPGDLSGLASFPALTSLTIFNMDLSRADALTPVTQLLQLQKLTLSDSQLSSLTALSDLTRLGYLNLTGNDIRDVSPLSQNAGIDAWDVVELSGNPIDCAQPGLHALTARGVLLSVDCP